MVSPLISRTRWTSLTPISCPYRSASRIAPSSPRRCGRIGESVIRVSPTATSACSSSCSSATPSPRSVRRSRMIGIYASPTGRCTRSRIPAGRRMSTGRERTAGTGGWRISSASALGERPGGPCSRVPSAMTYSNSLGQLHNRHRSPHSSWGIPIPYVKIVGNAPSDESVKRSSDDAASRSWCPLTAGRSNERAGLGVLRLRTGPFTNASERTVPP